VAELRGGVLILDKPTGLTSHDVVHVVRRALGRPRLGHTGTLDPFATGVLPLVVGRATRLAQFFSAADKEYDARIALGQATDTYDRTGAPVSAGRANTPLPTPAEVAAVLASFVGTHPQVPPPFSAKKADGTPAYERARRGQPVDLPPVSVTAHALTLVDAGPDWVDVRVHCSAGYYVRSLAHAVGAALGVGAHLRDLRRTRSGRFGLARALTLEVVLTAPDRAPAALVPLEDLLPEWPAVVVTADGSAWVGHGRPLGPGQVAGTMPAGRAGDRVRIVGPDGLLLAVGTRLADGTLHPGLVLG